LHELIRQYAHEQLRSANDWAQGYEQHLSYFVALAEEAEVQLEGAEQVTWLERLEQAHDNIRAALTWAFESAAEPSGRVDLGLRLTSALYRFWQGQGHLGEGVAWLERGLSGAAAPEARVRAKALNILGWLINQQGRHQQAMVALQESVALYRALGDSQGMAFALDSLGDVAWLQGDFEPARAYYQESLALCRELGNQWGWVHRCAAWSY
jgi:non-specific serine/threonine protein kinase